MPASGWGAPSPAEITGAGAPVTGIPTSASAATAWRCRKPASAPAPAPVTCTPSRPNQGRPDEAAFQSARRIDRLAAAALRIAALMPR